MTYDIRWLAADPSVVQIQIRARTTQGHLWHQIHYPKNLGELRAIVRCMRLFGVTRERYPEKPK